MKTPKDGIHYNVDFDEYQAWEAVNNSSLTPATRSAAHYQDSLQRAIARNSAAFPFGRLVHAAVTEPDTLDERYVIQPDFSARVTNADGTIPKNPRATKHFKELAAAFETANAGREVVSAHDWQNMESVVAAVRANAGEFFANGRGEVSLLWADRKTGTRCKARVDWLDAENGRAIDLKTTSDAQAFPASIAKYRYHRQAAFYCDGLAAVGLPVLGGFWFCVVEVAAPHGVMTAPCHKQMLLQGRREYRAALETLQHAESTGKYDGYQSPKHWRLPPWARDGLNLIIDGESKFLERSA